MRCESERAWWEDGWVVAAAVGLLWAARALAFLGEPRQGLGVTVRV